MSFVRDYFSDVEKVLSRLPEDTVHGIVDAIYTAYQNDKRLLLLGNGGSGATASHFANDFQKGMLLYGGKPFRALALVDSMPIILAWGNDTEYANIFEPQVQTWAEPGDVIIGISGSGNSENVLRAMRRANEQGAITVGLTGMGGGKLASIVKHSLVVDSPNMQKIEDVHSVVLHCIYSALHDRVVAERKQGVSAG